MDYKERLSIVDSAIWNSDFKEREGLLKNKKTIDNDFDASNPAVMHKRSENHG